jgi:D-arabinose 1-dehydrogenase-like Zn-dependent alcohol dehydrogenase
LAHQAHAAVPPGHEGAGIVAALGAGVTHLKEGDRVGIAWLHSACGHCDYCLAGWETLCPEQQNSGYSVNGSFAQYALGQADYLGRIPKSLSFVDAAPILCAGVTTYKGLKMTETKPGEWVVISGAGGLGHVAIQYAKAMIASRRWIWDRKKWRWPASWGRKSPLMRRRRILPRKSKNRSVERTACW